MENRTPESLSLSSFDAVTNLSPEEVDKSPLDSRRPLPQDAVAKAMSINPAAATPQVSASIPIKIPRSLKAVVGFDVKSDSSASSNETSNKTSTESQQTEVSSDEKGVEELVNEASHLGNKQESSPRRTPVGSLLSQRLLSLRDVIASSPAHQKPPADLPQDSPITSAISSAVQTPDAAHRMVQSQLSQFSQGSMNSSISAVSSGSNVQGTTPRSHQPIRGGSERMTAKKMKNGIASRTHKFSESAKNDQNPGSLRSLFGSITIFKSGSILSRYQSGMGSNQMVNYVTEAQSVLPSLTNAFSIDHLGVSATQLPLEMGTFDIQGNYRTMSQQDRMHMLDTLEESEYIDTIKSNDSAASLLRRSLSVPTQYQYKPQEKQKKENLQEIFYRRESTKEAVDLVTGQIVKKTIPAHIFDEEKWRKTMEDLLEQPEYLDSLESACSKTGLLASQARAFAIAQGYGLKPEFEPSISLESQASSKEVKFVYFKNLIVLSLGFMFMFIAYMSLRNLQSSLYKEGGLGIIALSSVYASVFIGSIFAPTVVQLLRPKPTLLACFGCMFIYIVANFHPAFYTLVPACAIVGFALSNLWTAHATYLANVASRYAAIKGDKVQNVLSQFNGIFFAFFQTSQIVGGLISSFILSPKSSTDGIPFGNFSDLNESIITTVPSDVAIPESVDILQCGCQYCSFIMDNLNSTMTEPIEQKLIYILIGIYAACILIGLLVIALCLDPLDGSMKKAHGSMLSQLTSVFRFFAQWKVVCLLGLMFYTLLQSSFMFGEFTKAFVTCTSGVYLVGYVMVCLSSFSATSAYVSGKLQRYLGRLSLLSSGLSIQGALLVVMLLWTPVPEQISVLFIISGLWGLADGIINTQSISLFGVIFADNKESAFAALKMCQSMGAAIMFASSEYMCTYAKIYVLLVFVVLAAAGYLVLEMKLKKQNKNRLKMGPTPV